MITVVITVGLTAKKVADSCGEKWTLYTGYVESDGCSDQSTVGLPSCYGVVYVVFHLNRCTFILRLIMWNIVRIIG